MQAASFDVGLLHPFVKTIARVAAHTRHSFLVHHNRPAAPFCLFGDDRRRTDRLRLLRGCRPSWSREPPGGARAVVLHLHCGSLLDWVIRRSLRGRSDYVVTVDTCPTCGGSGQVVEKYCGSCDGKGVNKKSKQLTITIPPGVEDSNRLRVRGEGDAGAKGGPPGDLYVFLSVKPDPRFRREGMEIYTDVTVSYVDAILGVTLQVPTVDGSVDLKMPAGTQPGTTLRIEGKGAPKLNNVQARGSQYVKVKVEIPQKLSNKEKELVTALKQEIKN